MCKNDNVHTAIVRPKCRVTIHTPGNKFDAGVYNYAHINFALDLFKVTEYCEGCGLRTTLQKCFLLVTIM